MAGYFSWCLKEKKAAALTIELEEFGVERGRTGLIFGIMLQVTLDLMLKRDGRNNLRMPRGRDEQVLLQQ